MMRVIRRVITLAIPFCALIAGGVFLAIAILAS
jgi:hypothetical protein